MVGNFGSHIFTILVPIHLFSLVFKWSGQKKTRPLEDQLAYVSGMLVSGIGMFDVD
jgi:hypothetical protein